MTPETGIHVDTTHWPLVVKRSGKAFQVDDMTRYLKDLDVLLARKSPFACIIVVKERGPLDRKIVPMYGDFVKARSAAMKEFYLGAAFVFPGDIFRFILSTILVAAPAPVPHAVFGHSEEAALWALDKLRARGVTPPPVNPASL